MQLERFRVVSPTGKGGPTSRDFVEMQTRLDRCIELLVRFCRTAVPSGTIIHANLTATEVDSDFDANGNGVAGRAWEGWAIFSDLDGRFIRSNVDEAGGTGGADTMAHTHAVDVASFTSGAESGHTHSTPAHAHDGSGLYALATVFGASNDGLRIKHFDSPNWTGDTDLTVTSGAAAANTGGFGIEVDGTTATDGSGTSGASSGHTHAVDPPSTTSGAASNTENRPAFYEAVPLVRL